MAHAETGPPAAVLVELFTSEGCSSCPPADEVLSDLVRRQPIPNVTVVALGEHVDYWDRLDWRDPFSSATFSARQTEYDARVFNTGSIYTPQLVVNGQYQALGSDRTAVARAIRNAAQSATARVHVLATAPDPDRTSVDIQVEIPAGMKLEAAGPVDVMMSVVENNLVTHVARGENSGRLLRHSVVARTLTRVGTMTPADRTFSRAVSVPLDKSWNRAALSVSVFLQDRPTRRIAGAASSPLGAVMSDDQ